MNEAILMANDTGIVAWMIIITLFEKKRVWKLNFPADYSSIISFSSSFSSTEVLQKL